MILPTESEEFLRAVAPLSVVLAFITICVGFYYFGPQNPASKSAIVDAITECPKIAQYVEGATWVITKHDLHKQLSECRQVIIDADKARIDSEIVKQQKEAALGSKP